MCHDSLKKRTMNVYPENNFYIDILERVEKLIYNLFRKQKFMIKNNGDENGMFKNLKIKIRYVNSADLYMYVYEDNVVVTASLYYKEEYIQRFILDSQSWINSAQQELLLENKDSKLPHKRKITAPECYKVCKFDELKSSDSFDNSNDCFAVSFQKVIELYISNESFRQVIDSEEYIYIEDYVCLNREQYINKRPSKFEITEYGRSHKNECCFSLSMMTTKDLDNELNEKVPVAVKEGVERADIMAKMMSKYHGGFAETFKQLLSESGLTVRELSRRSFVQEKTINRIKKGNDTTLQNLLALCCGLNLSVPQIELLLRKSGRFLRNEVAQDVAYKILLPYCSIMSIEEINLVLFRYGYDIWGSKCEVNEYSDYLSGLL